ncbi:hypothetical protein [Streptomyces sp. NPDC007346]|uniref:hypothetical protein n=1 Tax=Streptomyces sp. NPDC007346 TaxID=3154682 RepID=UPI0034566B15
MQRTRFTTKLLIGVAVTAVSGCVSVEPQVGPQRPPPSSGPVQDVFPQVVQPPGREALETIVEPGPSPAGPSTPARPSAAPAEARRAGPPPAPRSPERAAPPPHRTPPRRTPPQQVPGVPPGVLPDLLRARGGLPDVCALGRGYGGWPAGSREARICEETYGR